MGAWRVMRSLGPLASTDHDLAMPNGLLVLPRNTAMPDGSLGLPEHCFATAEATNVCDFPISEAANVVLPSDCNGKSRFIDSMSTPLRTGFGECSRFGALASSGGSNSDVTIHCFQWLRKRDWLRRNWMYRNILVSIAAASIFVAAKSRKIYDNATLICCRTAPGDAGIDRTRRRSRGLAREYR
jgi:hypothetical protein